MDCPEADEIERVLARLIDPQGRSYLRSDLIARFGFPDDRPDPAAMLDP